MIKVNKDYDNPPQILFSDACKRKIESALKEKSNHKIDRSIIGKEVRERLKAIYHNKCAYCESSIEMGSYLNIDHYRPIRGLKEDNSHPGYYWLAYEWSNLLLACERCNISKSYFFPLHREGVRVSVPPKDPREWKASSEIFKNEKPLLLNPELDDPESIAQNTEILITLYKEFNGAKLIITSRKHFFEQQHHKEDILI